MIRLGQKEDLSQIEAFDVFGGDRGREIERNCLRVYFAGNKVVGYLTAIDESCLCGHPLISFICVHPAHRRQGIASKLLTEVEDRYKTKKLFISTESNNSVMLNLIEQRNYLKANTIWLSPPAPKFGGVRFVKVPQDWGI